MTVTARIAREDAITDALRVADTAIGQEPPSAQALRIIAALNLLRSTDPVKVAQLAAVNYMARVQMDARAFWLHRHSIRETGPAHDATAGTDTPIGRLKIVTWRRKWNDGRIAWASEYYLDNEPITVAEITAAGLAQRPTTRQRRRS